MTTEIQEYTKTEAALADLSSRYKDAVYPVATTSGMKEAVAARAELRSLRVELERTRKEIKEPALRRCQQIDSEAKRITAALVALEDPIDAQIKAEEERKEREKAAKAEAERNRVSSIQNKIAAINAMPATLTGKSSAAIGDALTKMEAMEITEAEFAEFAPQASLALHGVRAQIVRMRDAQAEHEAEQERIRQERTELDLLRAQAAEREKADAERAAAERAKADAEAKAERDRLAAEQAALIAAEELERAEQRRLEEDARREQQRKEDERRAAEAEQLRKDREAAAAERARLEAQHLANVTLHDAASSAYDLLVQLGHGNHIVTRALQSALSRN